MRQDLKHELKRSAKLFLKLWGRVTLAFIVLGPLLFLIDGDNTETQGKLSQLWGVLDWKGRLWLAARLGGVVVAVAAGFALLVAMIEAFTSFGSGLRSEMEKGRHVFRIVLGVRLSLLMGTLFVSWVIIFGVDDGLATGFGWGVFWTTAGLVGAFSFMTVLVFRERVELTERAVYHRAWGWVQRRYAIEDISRFELNDSRVTLFLNSGKKVKLPTHLESLEQLTEALENMLKSRG